MKALTDNRNRTAPNIRHAFSKSSATLGETGSVSNFAFKYVGEIRIAGRITESLEEIIMDSGASDYFEESGEIIIITQWGDFAKVRNYLTAKGIELTTAEGNYLPTTTIDVTEFDKALKVHTLIETLEEDEDVEAVWHNAHIPQNLQDEIVAHIDSHRFRT